MLIKKTACNVLTNIKQFNFSSINWLFTLFLFPGYGREPGSDTPSFVQRKVDIPIYPNRAECNNRLKNALPAARQPDFQLSPGEICAGGEIGKDTCDGDGGAPLVYTYLGFNIIK